MGRTILGFILVYVVLMGLFIKFSIDEDREKCKALLSRARTTHDTLTVVLAFSPCKRNLQESTK